MSMLPSGNVALGAAFAFIVLILLALDLGLFRRHTRDPTFRESALWTAAWFGLAAAFGLGVAARMGPDQGLAFASAYLVEQSLSVDNLLVIIVIFAQFAVPRVAQRKALIAGVLGAVVMRTVMILGGTQLIAHFHAVTYLLGAVLVATAVKLALGGGDGDQAPEMPRAGLVERFVRRV